MCFASWLALAFIKRCFLGKDAVIKGGHNFNKVPLLLCVDRATRGVATFHPARVASVDKSVKWTDGEEQALCVSVADAWLAKRKVRIEKHSVFVNG